MKKVYAYIHTHWDREWYREFETFRIRLCNVFNDIITKLQNNELQSFYFDGQTSALEDFLEIYPNKKNTIKELIKEKRLFVGPYFCSTDSFLVDSESLIRNLQLGIRYSKEFGCEEFIAYHADTFGHSAQIPDIIKYFNIDKGIFWRGAGSNKSEIIFNGLSSVYLIEGYFHDELTADITIEKKSELLKKTLDKIGTYSSDNILLPLGADHLAIGDNIKNQIAEINKHLNDYKIIITTPFDYFRAVEQNFVNVVDGELRSNERNFILPGVYSSRIDIKKKNAASQWALSRQSEPIQGLMSYLGKSKNYQNQIDYAYKILIKNHAHDSIYGCSIDPVHKENLNRYENVLQITNCIAKNVENELAQKFDELFVCNLSNYNLDGAVKYISDKKLPANLNAQLIKISKGFPLKKIYSENQIPITEDYCNLYEYLIDVKNTEKFSIKKLQEKIQLNSTLKISDTSIENQYIKLFIKNGKINLEDKKKNKIHLDFINFTNRADIGDSYNFGALKNDKKIKAKILKSEIFEKGHIRNILKLKAELQIPKFSNKNGRSKKIIKTILNILVILENQNEFIEFKIDWENKSENHIVQAEFNFETNIETTFSDDLLGINERKFDSDYDIYKQIPALRGIELKYNTAPLQKFVSANETGIITKGLHEYEISKNKLSITLLIATGTISNPKNPTRGTPAGPPLPTPDLQMQGKNSVNFAIIFDNNLTNIEKNTEKFYGATFILHFDKNIKFIKNLNEKIKINAIKTNEKNELIIRLLNTSTKPVPLSFQTDLIFSEIKILNCLEEEVSDFETKKLNPREIITLKFKH